MLETKRTTENIVLLLNKKGYLCFQSKQLIKRLEISLDSKNSSQGNEIAYGSNIQSFLVKFNQGKINLIVELFSPVENGFLFYSPLFCSTKLNKFPWSMAYSADGHTIPVI